jgi:flagellar hook-length control protein FliK
MSQRSTTPPVSGTLAPSAAPKGPSRHASQRPSEAFGSHLDRELAPQAREPARRGRDRGTPEVSAGDHARPSQRPPAAAGPATTVSSRPSGDNPVPAVDAAAPAVSDGAASAPAADVPPGGAAPTPEVAAAAGPSLPGGAGADPLQAVDQRVTIARQQALGSAQPHGAPPPSPQPVSAVTLSATTASPASATAATEATAAPGTPATAAAAAPTAAAATAAATGGVGGSIAGPVRPPAATSSPPAAPEQPQPAPGAAPHPGAKQGGSARPPGGSPPSAAAQPAVVSSPAAVSQPAAVAQPGVVSPPAAVSQPAAVAQPGVVSPPAAVSQPAAVAQPAVVSSPAAVSQPPSAPASPLAGDLALATGQAVPTSQAAAPTPSPAQAAEPRAGVLLSEAAHTVRLTISAARAQGVSHVRIALRPAELGGIEIMLAHGPAGLSATVMADSTHAAQALQRAADELQRTLAAQGVNLVSLEIGVAGDDAAARGREERRASADDLGARHNDATRRETDAPTPPRTLELPTGLLVDVLA